MSISIHAAREGGDLFFRLYLSNVKISIHAAREGGDPIPQGEYARMWQFQSTPPVKAATLAAERDRLKAEFQSTPPVKAATCKNCPFTFNVKHFNPRRP